MTLNTAGNIGGSVHAVRDNMDPTQPRDSECRSCSPLDIHRKCHNSRRSRLGLSFSFSSSFSFLLVFFHVMRVMHGPAGRREHFWSMISGPGVKCCLHDPLLLLRCNVQMPTAGALQGGATMVREPNQDIEFESPGRILPPTQRSFQAALPAPLSLPSLFYLLHPESGCSDAHPPPRHPTYIYIDATLGMLI
jgi:hypothetical protein